MKEAMTLCSFCGCGCGIYASVEDGILNKTIPSLSSPISQGSLCFKGWHMGEVYINASRIKKPLIRVNDGFKEVGFAEALERIGQRFRLVKDKEKAFGIIGSAKTTNEENYLLNRFARQIMGTNNIDSSFTLHFLPVLENIPKLHFALGLHDIEKSDLIILIGSNLAVEAPQVFRRVLKALDANAKVAIINTLSVPLSDLAHVSMQPDPDGYGRIIGALSNLMKNTTKTKSTPEEADKLKEIASLYRKAKNPVAICGEDIFKGANAREDFSLLVKLFENRLFPLFSVNNALGALVCGVTPYIETEQFEKKWNRSLPKGKGLNIVEMLKAALAGSLKCLYVVGEDILLSMGDYHHTRKALENLEFLVVQDLFLSETAKLADVILPACSSLEKSGTYTNMEGRPQYAEQVMDPQAESRPDWQILLELAKEFDSSLPYRNLPEISREIDELNLLKDKRIARAEVSLAIEKTDREFPLWIRAGNPRLFFHSGSLLKNSSILGREMEPNVAMVNLVYAKENQIQNNEKVRIISKTGEMTINVQLCSDIQKQAVCIRPNLTDFSHTAIFPVGLKWTAGRMEKIK